MRAHGTTARYRHGPDENNQPGKGCGCPQCRAAATRSVKQYRLALAQGGLPRLVDAHPVREHVRALNAQGLPITSIAAKAGVPYCVLSCLLYGQNGRGMGPSKRMRRENADALLAVAADQAGPSGYTLAIGSRRRLQALAWSGWPSPCLASKVGLEASYVTRLARGKTPGLLVRVETAQQVAAVFADLWNVDPVTAGIAPARVSQVRTYALRRGYVSALAWDDIDNPDERPSGVRRRAAS